MSSVAEAELGALFLNAKAVVPIRKMLEEMGHPQPAMPVQTDDSTANGIVINEIQPKATKAMDMRFHWLCDREAQKQFRIYWRPGKTNLADYWTKHHPVVHHKKMRPGVLTPWCKLEKLRSHISGWSVSEKRLHKRGSQPSAKAARVC